MGLSSAMDWWDEWKLRILVLCSLSVQFFLLLSGYVRRWYILRWLRVVVWIAYIGGDALAIYALATLFNRQKQRTTVDGGGSALEVIWAPVLLIHLGGQEQISAYSLEDNELWKRLAITLVSQVAVALYVFCKWWSGEKRLLQSAVLLFIVGILRFSQKPWALRRASFRTMASANVSQWRSDEKPMSKWRAICTCHSFIDDIFPRLLEEKMEDVPSLEEFVERARDVIKEAKPFVDEVEQEKELIKNSFIATKDICKMFLDLSPPYSIRLHYLKLLLKFDDKHKHRMLQQWIVLQFSSMYTRMRSSVTCLGLCSQCLLPGLALASLVLFAKSVKDGYSKSDITVTYILFSATVVMDFAPILLSFLMVILVRCNITGLQAGGVDYIWQDMVSQHNIMLFCAQKKKPTTLLMKFASAFSSYLRDYINKHWCIWHEPAAQQISVLVRQHTEDVWKAYIHGPATYRRFSNLRGEKTLKKHNLLGQLGWSFALPFDECVLVWHVATDLCSFHHTTTSTRFTIPPPSRNSSEIISNHMIYLLFVCPEMLMVGTRQDLFMNACGHIEPMIKDYEPEPLSSHDRASIIAQRILGMERDDDLMVKAPMISNAHKLAEGLIGLDDTRRWEVIQGVWVEMLCYSASRCRGYEHAKSLAHGGEFLTNVWLLWSVMGMETLPDKMHNPAGPESDPDEEQPPPAASGWH
ncbi:unnamed protein product [Urochloa humidicola]